MQDGLLRDGYAAEDGKLYQLADLITVNPYGTTKCDTEGDVLYWTYMQT